MNVIALQLDIAWENKPANFERVRQILTATAPKHGSLVALPEMFATGFSMNTSHVAEAYGGETERFLSEAAREFGVFIVGGAAMQGSKGKPRNKALIFGPDGALLGFYAKMRPFTLGGEGDYYEAGQGPVIFKCGQWTVSPFVCYDLRFPELFRQVTATNRPELFVVIANWPTKRITHWVRLLQARAIENQAYVIGVNRVGTDPFYAYNGHSLVVDYNGDVLADANNKPAVIQVSLDLELLKRYREGLPFLEDLRTTSQNQTARGN